MDGVKLYLVAGDGSDLRVLVTEDGALKPIGGAVWSPDGRFIAFAVERVNCDPCRSVGLVRVSDGTVNYLETPDNQDSEAPRWTHDGRLLVVVHPAEPADGVTYVYSTASYGQPASGIYVLGSSHEGQKWLPWLPGRVWQAGVSERPDTYYD
jgi:Tol biopolymer transport system component